MAPSRSIHRLARVVVATMAVLGAGGSVALAGALIAGAGTFAGPPGAEHDVTIAGRPVTYPSANVAALVIIALAGVGLLAVVRAVRCVRRHASSARRLRPSLAGTPTAPSAPVRLGDRRPVAFCAGLFAPRVYVSEGAVRALDDRELRAVLAHEEQHRLRRDPLRILVVTCLAEALFFLPVVARLRDRYAALIELRADDAAVAACGGDPGPLAGAMMAFDAAGAPAGSTGIAPERVDRLLGAPPTLDIGGWAVVGAALTIVAMLAGAWGAGRAASLKATFALPVLSQRPCVMAFAAVPVALVVAAAALRLRTGRGSPGGHAASYEL